MERSWCNHSARDLFRLPLWGEAVPPSGSDREAVREWPGCTGGCAFSFKPVAVLSDTSSAEQGHTHITALLVAGALGQRQCAECTAIAQARVHGVRSAFAVRVPHVAVAHIQHICAGDAGDVLGALSEGYVEGATSPRA